MTKPKSTPPASAAPEPTFRVNFKAYIDPDSALKIMAWQEASRTSPQQPSNGVMVDRLVKFAVAKGFNPKPSKQ